MEGFVGGKRKEEMEVRDDGGVSGCRCRSVGGRPKEKVSSARRKVCCYGRKVMVRRGASSQASHGSQKKRNERRGAEDRGHGAVCSVQSAEGQTQGLDVYVLWVLRSQRQLVCLVRVADSGLRTAGSRACGNMRNTRDN